MRYEKHIFVCVNSRKPDDPKGCCSIVGGDEIRIKFLELIAKHGLKQKVRTNKSGCLDACEMGSNVVIYPSGVWYPRVKIEDVEEIFTTSILRDGVVDRLAGNKETWEELSQLRKKA